MYRAVIGYLNICRADKLEEETKREKTKTKVHRNRKWLTRITKLTKQKRNSNNTNRSTSKPTSTLDFEFDSNDLEYYMKNYSSSTSESTTSQVHKQIQPNNNDSKHNKDEHKVVVVVLLLLIIRVNYILYYIFIIISTPCLIRLYVYYNLHVSIHTNLNHP